MHIAVVGPVTRPTHVSRSGLLLYVPIISCLVARSCTRSLLLAERVGWAAVQMQSTRVSLRHMFAENSTSRKCLWKRTSKVSALWTTVEARPIMSNGIQ